jgi:SEC-C motif-containing protein
MRSRYSAYVLGLGNYLRDTWHPSTRPSAVELETPGPRWLGLEVRRQRALPDATSAAGEPVPQTEVEFVARCKQGGRATRLHETSRFLREDGHWLYVDGVQG